MASVNETKQGHEYRVVVSGGGLVFKIYDGEGKGAGVIENLNPADNMADRVMEEIGDSFPFQIIEGGRKDKTVRDRNVIVVFDSGGIPRIEPGIMNKFRRNLNRLLTAITGPFDG